MYRMLNTKSTGDPHKEGRGSWLIRDLLQNYYEIGLVLWKSQLLVPSGWFVQLRYDHAKSDHCR